MTTGEEQLVLQHRLQEAEDDLIAAGLQHVTIDGTMGVFTWVRPGAHRMPARAVVIDDIQLIEDMIVSQRWADIIVPTDHGTWMWRPR
jgi:hypothetical protein